MAGTMAKTLLGAAAISAATASLLAANTAPYSGQDAREIAALSEADIDDLLNGRGWGFALPAELNGYPGPTHVLELADELGLSTDQVDAIEAIRAAMSADARALGADYVAAEAALDAAFETGQIDPERLVELTTEAAEIEARLRAVHLAAHLEVTPLLSRHQVMTYNQLRGYGPGATGAGDHSGHGNH